MNVGDGLASGAKKASFTTRDARQMSKEEWDAMFEPEPEPEAKPHEHEWSEWHHHHNGGEVGMENNWRECKTCGTIEKNYERETIRR